MTEAINVAQTFSKPGYMRYIRKSDGAELYRAGWLRPTHRITETRPASYHTAPDAQGKYVTPKPWAHVSGNHLVSTLVAIDRGTYLDERSEEQSYWYPKVVGLNFEPLKADAIRKAAAGVGDNVRQMNVFFREAAEVLSLTHNFGNAVQKGLHTLTDLCEKSWLARRQMKTFLRNGWRDVPSCYLAYIFGVAPLAEDLQNSVSTLNDLVDSDAEIIFTAKGRADLYEDYETLLGGIFGGYAVYATVRRHAIARANLRFAMSASNLGALKFVTPFSQAYETTRLSFVLDYILPVGPWLSAMEGCQIAPYFRDGSVSLKVSDLAIDCTAYSASPIAYQKCEASGWYEHYQREVLGGFPYLTILKPPRFKLPGISQLGVVAALIGQRLNKLVKVIYQR